MTDNVVTLVTSDKFCHIVKENNKISKALTCDTLTMCRSPSILVDDVLIYSFQDDK